MIVISVKPSMRKCATVLLIAIVLLPLMVNTAIALNCFSALQDLISCEDYLIGGASKPSTGCCQGVKDLAKIASKSRSERQSLCRCLKSAAQNFPIDEKKAKSIGKLCHVNLNITISPHVDCTKV